MVYCGKASQGRVAKKCPGYRDQLSLMFRDETSKVVQKSHASWGTTSPDQAHQPSSATSAVSTYSPWSSSSPSSTTSSDGSSPPSRRPSTAVAAIRKSQAVSPRICMRVEPTIEQKGYRFFLDRYLLGQPDAPTNSEQLAAYASGPDALQNVMVAVGLAGLSNTQGDRAMNVLSRQKYTDALRQTSQLIAAKPTQPGAVMFPVRAVITLALFEIVQGGGSKLSTGTANIHIHGAIALLRGVLPIRTAPAGGVRGILQLMFSLFIPSQLTETPLPAVFFEALEFCKPALPVKEQCCCDLAITIARFLRVVSTLKTLKLTDGDLVTEGIFRQLLELDNVFEGLEIGLQAAYPFYVEEGDFPPAAVFQGKYHAYSEIWGARLWNHLRWARILVVQKLLDVNNEIAVRMAEDTIISAPSHWNHPILDPASAKKFAAGGKGGSGGVGLPALLWHLKIAGCAPGVPPEYWEWTYNLIQVVWKNMGMHHALALAEVMEGHRAGLEQQAIDRILKKEDEDW
ncbi:hypothetical protein PG994_009408 [Apiospora phragmitis]|uniref:Uncharacterized protein n=1 Tax=Apiospora phragmitis TaxID=2905665 RepID=A0ABR1UJ74_9PEZI